MTVTLLLVAATASFPPQSPAPAAAMARQPVAFVTNHGQWDAAARFAVDQGRSRIWVTDDALWLEATPEDAAGDRIAVRLSFVGAEPGWCGEAPLPAVRNYLIGQDPSRHRCGVPSHAVVRANELYPHTDLVLRDQDGHLEYDLVLRPGADLHRIVVAVAGHERLLPQRDGSLRIETALGALHQSAPVTWVTNAAGERTEIPCRVVVIDTDRFGFVVDGWNGNDELTIDPGLLWGSLLGGAGFDRCRRVAYDANGNVVVAGDTTSSNLPTTPGVVKATNPSNRDAFVAVFQPNGSALVYCTYVGGSGDEQLDGLFVYQNIGGVRVAISGTTRSTNFPVSADRFQATLGGGADSFVAVLNGTGTGFEFATYFGFGGDQEQTQVWVQPNGNVFFAGRTTSTLPATSNAYQPQLAGPSDAFFAVFNRTQPGSTSLLYCSHFGGSGDEVEVTSLHVAPNDIATIGMATLSTDIAATATNFQATHAGGGAGLTGHIFCLQPGAVSGPASLVYSSYFGQAAGTTWGLQVEMDMGGMFNLIATTSSTTWPTSTNALQRNYGGGASDGLVGRLNPGATGAAALLWLSYLGGSDADTLTYFFRDPAAAAGTPIAVCGHTRSPDIAVTPTALQATPQDLGQSGYLAVLDPSASGVAQLSYGSYFDGCGSSDDALHAIHRSSAGILTVVGETAAAVAPATGGAFRIRSAGGVDGIVARLDTQPQPPLMGLFGSGCGVAGFVPAIVPVSPPRMSQPFQVDIANLRAGGAGFMFIGLSDTNWLGIPLPRDLTGLGLPGCQQWVSTDEGFLVVHAGSSASFGFTTPASPLFYGTRFFLQYAAVDPAANTFGAALSNAFAGTVLY